MIPQTYVFGVTLTDDSASRVVWTLSWIRNYSGRFDDSIFQSDNSKSPG